MKLRTLIAAILLLITLGGIAQGQSRDLKH